MSGGSWYADGSLGWLGWLVDPVIPSIMVFLVFLTSTIFSYLSSAAQRRFVRDRIERYEAEPPGENCDGEFAALTK